MLKVLSICLGVLGPFLAYPALMALVAWWRYRRFPQRAQRVEARLQGVRRGHVGGEDPYTYFVLVWRWQHPVTRRLHFFKSDDLADDPTPFVERYKVVQVLVDPDHPDRYQLDEPKLEKLAARLRNGVEARERHGGVRPPPSERELERFEAAIIEAANRRGRRGARR